MRRIVEGLGLGLARRAARKLVPVVLTLGSGPSGFPRNLSGRRPKLPRQPRRGRVARARSRNFDAGSWPVGLLETTFRATAEASATAMANPRRRTRAPLFWRWGLARRASRNNFPGDGQSFCDSLPRARFRRFGAGGWPDGLPETSFRAMQSGGILDADSHGKPAPSHARAPLFRRWGLARRASGNNLPGEASATAMANPRRRTRALRYFGAGGWPVGLPETIFRATAKASATASLALASVVLALGVGPTGFPKQVSERCRARGSWTPTAMANPRRRTRALRYFGAGGWPVGLLETTFRATAEASATAMANPRRRIILALGAGPSGFPKQFSGRRPKLLRQPPSRSLPSFWRWGLARRASRNKFPSDAKRGDLGRRQPWQTRAVARARSVISALGAGPSGFRKQSSGRSFRDSHGKPAPSLAHAPLFWRWGLARRASRNKFPSDAKRGDLGGRRGICGPKPMSQHGRPRFSRARARPVAAMAVLSTRSGQMARSLASGCGWPISYCPV